MADAKFGPWEACSNLIREKRTAESGAGFLVAEVPANTEGASAKATLMAAAPELFGVVDALIKSFRMAGIAADLDSNDPAEWLMAKAVMAHSKALGDRA
ncbi:hypothetical protein [Cupriavidus malaysiensis]|uniref:Uncharacterized protein n=1 Tax=Cupriavidus malaysiensis TaxID=367825 RepID=A0ABN4THR1_9BURK|nr:hypothetical protein [Cupriavidus malaysiensis]AOZ06733.1 hypothetical protein BKK80_13590 [Cupriavidus malaysiensis]